MFLYFYNFYFILVLYRTFVFYIPDDGHIVGRNIGVCFMCRVILVYMYIFRCHYFIYIYIVLLSTSNHFQNIGVWIIVHDAYLAGSWFLLKLTALTL